MKQSLIRDLQYRSSWIIHNLVTIAWSLMRLVYFLVAYQHVTQVGDWNYSQAIALAATFMIVNSFVKIVYEVNLLRFVDLIYTGELDHILTKPVSSQFVMSTRIVTYRGLVRTIIGLILLIYSYSHFSGYISPLNLLVYFWMLLMGFSIAYSLSYIAVTLCFWLGYVSNLYQTSNIFVSMSYMPYDTFPKTMQQILTFFIPIMFLATIPTKLLYQINYGWLGYGTIASILLLWFSTFLWKKGLQSYSSASS